ncbi:MAG: septum formation initiator family protein, partial [Deltaproteobacteria bacterium]|nr:septum formation initiator family protein [Deltaproteobacteria bacterium]
MNNTYSFLIILGCMLFILLYACFGERGLIRVLVLKKELKEIESCNQNLRENNVALKESIYRLKNDKRYIERIAREELGLVK